MQQEEALETIMKLGLTLLQAKVYLALAKSGPTTGRMTASAAQIASNDVYRVLKELQEKGLVEKIIANPTMYKTEQSEGLFILLNKKKEEYIETKKQVKALNASINKLEKDKANLEPSQQFEIISQAKLLTRINEKIAATTKQSIDFVYPTRLFGKKLLEDFQYAQSAIKRGVKIRVITLNDEKGHNSHNGKQQLFEQRTVPESGLPFEMHIFDKQQLTIALSEQEIPSLLTNNLNIVSLAQAYFNTTWNRANNTNK